MKAEIRGLTMVNSYLYYVIQRRANNDDKTAIVRAVKCDEREMGQHSTVWSVSDQYRYKSALSNGIN